VTKGPPSFGWLSFDSYRDLADGEVNAKGVDMSVEEHLMPCARAWPIPDGGPAEHRMGGDADLIDGCTVDHFWLFPDEAFSTYCGDVGDACQFICATRVGCRVEAPQGEPQQLYCPAADAARLRVSMTIAHGADHSPDVEQRGD
jgi:hypothetical protein